MQEQRRQGEGVLEDRRERRGVAKGEDVVVADVVVVKALLLLFSWLFISSIVNCFVVYVQEWVQVHYGSDLDVREYGSGFPLNSANQQRNNKPDQRKANESAGKNKKVYGFMFFVFGCFLFVLACFVGLLTFRKLNPDDEMRNSGWNVNNLPRRTFLHHINEVLL
jgi:hypothetical protein